MKKKNGFTLIELLAVIVILAIIALIATPIVLNLIEKVRLGAAKDSAYGVRKSAQLYYQAMLLDNINGFTDNVTISFNDGIITSSLSSNVEYTIDGTVPKSGSIIITKDGEVSGSVVINGYTCTIENTGTIECTKGESGTEEVTHRKYENGEIVYYNPTTNKFCSNYNIDNSITEYKGDATSKTTDNQTGCLKWYAYLDSEESDEVKLLLDHNTTALVQWNEDNNNVELGESNLSALLTSLNEDSKWILIPSIISASDIAEITDNGSWNAGGVDYYFDSNGDSPVAIDKGTSNYSWLYDYTYECESHGCSVENNSTYTNITNNEVNNIYGYWTSTPYEDTNSSTLVWYVHRFGYLRRDYANNTSRGLRPVVTVKKNAGHDGTSRVYYNGEIVYFNPVTNTQCYNYVEDNSTTGYKGENDPNKTENQNGCLRWFAYLDSGSATDLKSLADHNTTATIRWYDTAEYKTLEESNLQTELDDLVDENGLNWKPNTSIISATDIALITDYAGTNGGNWDSTNNNNYYNFDTNTSASPETYGAYWWLYDRMNSCIDYGCHIADSSTYSYWTNTNVGTSGSLVWLINRFGRLANDTATNTGVGFRPVITISKSLLD